MATVSPSPKFCAFDNNGNPLAGGKLYTYAAGTTTPLATYTTQAGTTANANPVILDSAGRADVWLGTAAYKFVLKDSTGSTIWTVDNLAGNGSSFGIFNVVDYGADKTGATNTSVAIVAAINAAIAAGSGIVYFPRGIYGLSSGITLNNPYITFLGEGSGNIDGNQQFNDTWANIVAKVPSRIKWIGSAGSTMFTIQPVDDGAHTALNGCGIKGLMIDGNELAATGLLTKTLRWSRFEDLSVVRCTFANISEGVVSNPVYGGNTSNCGNTWINVCASNANLTSTCNLSIPWVHWGIGLVGNVCESAYINCQAFQANFNILYTSWLMENSDDNSFYECKWNSTCVLASEDSGTFSTTSSLAQNHFFYKTLGHITAKTNVGVGKQATYGHAVYGYSNNNNIPLPTVEAGADISIFGCTIDYIQKLGLMSYGTQPAITLVSRTSNQSIANNTTTDISWSAESYDRLDAWVVGTPTIITVPNNVKWYQVTLQVSWDSNSTAGRYAGIYYDGSPVAEEYKQAYLTSDTTVQSRILPCTPGKQIICKVLQNSGGALNINSKTSVTVQWF